MTDRHFNSYWRRTLRTDASTELFEDLIQSLESQPRTHESWQQITRQLNILFDVIFILVALSELVDDKGIGHFIYAKLAKKRELLIMSKYSLFNMQLMTNAEVKYAEL